MLEKILIGLAVAVVVVLVVVALQPADYPFARMDPAARNTFEGAPAGVGAALAWSGNAQIGQGRLTIIESRPADPEAGGTAVTWSMTGRKNLVSKALGLVMSMDRMIGGQFEQGLATLKSLTEATSAARR
jgi:hypothetical protein